MAFDAGAIEARLTLSREDFNRELDAARADGRRFASEDFSARAGLRDDEFRAKRDQILAQIAELEAMRADPSVDINDAEAKAKLDELSAELARFGLRHDTATVDVDTSKADEGLGRVREEAVAAQSASIGLGTAVVALGPAAGAALAPVAAGLGAALVPLTAATFGFGALAAVALPTLSQVKDALSKPNEELSKMPPEIAQVVGGVRAFQGEWGVLASKLQPDVLGIMNQGLTIGRGLLPQLVAPAHEAALALGDLGRSAQRDLGSPVWRGWSTSMTAEVRPAIDALGHSFGNLVAGLGGVINAFVPFASSFESGMVRITNSFRLWGENLGTTQGFQTFMQYVKDNAGTVGHLLEDTGKAFVSLANALSGFGAIELRVIDGFVQFIDTILRIPVLGPIIGDLSVLGFTAAKLAPAFTLAGDAIGGFAAKADLLLATRLGVWLTDAAAGLGLFTTGLSIAGAASLTLQAALGPLGIALAALAAGYGYLVAQQAGASKQGQEVANAMDSQSQATLHSAMTQADYRAAAKQSSDALTRFNEDLNDHNRSVSQQDAIHEQLIKTWQQTTKETDNATAALKLIDQQTGLTDQQVSALARTLNVDLTKTAPAEALMRVKAALQADADQTGLTTDAFAQLAAGAGKSMSEITKAVKDAQDATSKAFSDFGDITKAKLGTAFGVLGSDISKFYTDNVKQAQVFSENVNKAIQAGYDPQLISRILQAGPAQAGPLLQAMVNNASSKFVEMMNNGEKALSDLTQKAIEQQRLMTLAVQSGSNQMSQDLSKAMQADQIIMAQGGQASVSGLAKSLNEGIPQVLGQLNEFGIHFKLSSDDYGRIMDAGGKEAADNIANALANGQHLTKEQLDLIDAAFGKTATDAETHGADAGNNFGNAITTDLRNHLRDLGIVMSDYDASLAGGVNPIIASIGGKTLSLSPQQAGAIGLPVGASYATGGFITAGPQVLVGEGNAPEAVIPFDPAHRANALALYKQTGEALGVDNKGCSCGMAAGGLVGLQGGGFLDPAQVPKPPGAILNFGTVPLSFGNATNQVATNEYNQVVAWAQAQAALRAAAAGAGIGGSGPSIPNAACDALIAQGLALAGPSARMSASCMRARLDNESGCNPNVGAGCCDINNTLGHPSVGIAQFVPSTFAANSVAGCTDINNPVCQIAASAHCDPGNCGHGGYGCQGGCITGTMGAFAPVPLASGGIMDPAAKAGMDWLVAMIPGFPRTTGEIQLARTMGLTGLAEGGIVTGPTIAAIGERGPEAVVPLGHGGAFGGTTVHVTIQGDVTSEAMPRLEAAFDRLGHKLTALGIHGQPGGATTGLR